MIQVESIHKSFGSRRAVDGVSFTVERGEVLGFLGPNGAGKSTTMRMITGFIAPDSGRISVCGYDITSQPIDAKSRIGYLPESAPTYTDMTVSGFLRWVADMRGLAGAEKRRAVDRAIEMCSLADVVNQTIDTLSKGFRHRTCLAQSILHDPDVLILDEPTDGLDPNQKREVRNLIRRMSADKAIIFSTHILEEVEAVCSRAIVIDRGRIVANATPAELKARSRSAGQVTALITGATQAELRPALDGVSQLVSFVIEPQGDSGCLLQAWPQPGQASELVIALAAVLNRPGWRIQSLQTDEGHLDDVFYELTRPDVATHSQAASQATLQSTSQPASTPSTLS